MQQHASIRRIKVSNGALAWASLTSLSLVSYMMRHAVSSGNVMAFALMIFLLWLKIFIITTIFMKSRSLPLAINILLHGWNAGVIVMIALMMTP